MVTKQQGWKLSKLLRIATFCYHSNESEKFSTKSSALSYIYSPTLSLHPQEAHNRFNQALCVCIFDLAYIGKDASKNRMIFI